MVHLDKCPLCDSERFVLHARCKDHFLSSEEFELVRCSGCGFVLTQDHPSVNDAGKYYESEDYISHNDNATGFSNLLYRFSRNIMLRRKRRLVKEISGLKEGTLLDIGSGTGHFLNEMKNAGWETRGIEISEKAREYSISKFGLEVLDPENINSLETGSYDCVTLWHVLEHFQDPFTYVREVHRLLKPGGKCLVAMPNCSSYDAVHYGRFWAAYDVPRHLWHFTPGTFRLFSEKEGFKLTGICQLPLDVFYISALSEKYKGSRLSFIKGMLKGSWFALLSLFRKNRNSSLIYLLRRT